MTEPLPRLTAQIKFAKGAAELVREGEQDTLTYLDHVVQHMAATPAPIEWLVISEQPPPNPWINHKIPTGYRADAEWSKTESTVINTLTTTKYYLHCPAGPLTMFVELVEYLTALSRPTPALSSNDMKLLSLQLYPVTFKAR